MQGRARSPGKLFASPSQTPPPHSPESPRSRSPPAHASAPPLPSLHPIGPHLRAHPPTPPRSLSYTSLLNTSTHSSPRWMKSQPDTPTKSTQPPCHHHHISPPCSTNPLLKQRSLSVRIARIKNIQPRLFSSCAARTGSRTASCVNRRWSPIAESTVPGYLCTRSQTAPPDHVVSASSDRDPRPTACPPETPAPIKHLRNSPSQVSSSAVATRDRDRAYQLRVIRPNWASAAMPRLRPSFTMSWFSTQGIVRYCYANPAGQPQRHRDPAHPYIRLRARRRLTYRGPDRLPQPIVLHRIAPQPTRICARHNQRGASGPTFALIR